MTHPELIYKVATAEAVAAAQARGEFPRMPIDVEDGFVHFSTAAQTPGNPQAPFRGAERSPLQADIRPPTKRL